MERHFTIKSKTTKKNELKNEITAENIYRLKEKFYNEEKNWMAKSNQRNNQNICGSSLPIFNWVLGFN